MRHLLHGLERHGIGRRAITEADFYSICEKERIAVIWSDLPFSFYFAARDVRCITLPKKLSGLRLLFHALHELGHAFTHSGLKPAVYWHGICHDRNESEANAVALIALYPSPFTRPTIDSRFAAQLWQDRERLYFLYGI